MIIFHVTNIFGLDEILSESLNIKFSTKIQSNLFTNFQTSIFSEFSIGSEIHLFNSLLILPLSNDHQNR